MRKTPQLRAFTIALLAAGLSGCGEDISCSSPEARQLVEQILLKDAEKAGLIGPNLPSLTHSLSAIITTEKGKTKTSCKAVLTMTFSVKGPPERSHSSDANITYAVEKTDDGRLYVTVYGL